MKHSKQCVLDVDLHFGQDVSHNSSTIVLCYVRELRPGQSVVKIVLHLVVLRQAQQIAVLHVEEILGLKDKDEEGDARTGDDAAIHLLSHT